MMNLHGEIVRAEAKSIRWHHRVRKRASSSPTSPLVAGVVKTIVPSAPIPNANCFNHEAGLTDVAISDPLRRRDDKRLATP